MIADTAPAARLAALEAELAALDDAFGDAYSYWQSIPRGAEDDADAYRDYARTERALDDWKTENECELETLRDALGTEICPHCDAANPPGYERCMACGKGAQS